MHEMYAAVYLMSIAPTTTQPKSLKTRNAQRGNALALLSAHNDGGLHETSHLSDSDASADAVALCRRHFDRHLLRQRPDADQGAFGQRHHRQRVRAHGGCADVF